MKNLKKSSSILAGFALSSTTALIMATLCTPTHAQFGGFLQSLMQAPMQQAQQDAAAQAAAQAAEKPSKKWEAAKPVLPEIDLAATAFANKTSNAQLRPLFKRLYIEGERNATLNFQRIGMAALALGETNTAEKAFEGAVTRIEMIYADNPEAQKAKSLWTAEKIKDFKGEPYERAMAYFYRGLVYAAKADFQNARAMFKQADYQDTVAESEKYAGDFGLMPYMAGWASYCDGDGRAAKDYLDQAIKGDATYTQVAVDRPVLVLMESGRAPFKYGAGKAREILKWQAHDAPLQVAKKACADSNSSSCDISAFVKGADIGFQATTRGGRPIDGVLGGKAAFKEGAEGVASFASTVGSVGMQTAMSTGNSDAASIGLLGMFAGLVAQGVAQSTQAQADVREWEQLPANIWLGTGSRKSNLKNLSVAVDVSGQTSHFNAAKIVDTPSCQLFWGRTQTPLSLASEAGPLEPGENKRDPVFRNEIQGMFADQQ